MAVSAVSLPFREQNEFLRRKLNLPTNAWTDIYTREHDYAFVVAGANRDQLVADFRRAVERAIEDGGSLEEFRREFDAIVARHGWSYNGGRNWRSRVIYETNLRSSYMAGRYEQLMAVREERPFWQYIHSDAVEHPRPEHEALNGLILYWNDPWWKYFFPINAWGCQCSVRALSWDDLRRMGKSGPDTAPPIVMEQRTIGQRGPSPRVVEVPQGIDPGFEYVPGQSRYEAAIPPQQPPPPIQPVPSAGALEPLPPARPAPTQLIQTDDIADGFLQQLGTGVNRPAVVVRDIIGERLVIGPSLFDQALPVLTGLTPGLQSQLMVSTLLDSDEIWTRIEWSAAVAKAVVRRRYIARYRVPGVVEPVVIVMELGTDGWWVLPSILTARQLAAVRNGVRLYARED